MSRHRGFVMLLDGLALAGLLFVLLFPAVTSVSAVGMGLGGATRPLALQEGGPLALVSWVLAHSDSGGQQEAGSGLLRGAVLLAAVLWLLRPRRLDPALRAAVLTGAAFTLVVLLSAVLSTQVRDALAAWGDWLAMGLCFLLVASLARDYREFPVLHLGALAFLVADVMVLPAAWYIFLTNPDANAAMFGSFYQPNMLAGYLLLALPLATATFLSAEGDGDPDVVSSLLGGLAAVAIAVTLYHTYSRAAWAISVLAVLLTVAFLPGRRALVRGGLALLSWGLGGVGAGLVVLGHAAPGFPLLAVAAAGAVWLLVTLPDFRRRLLPILVLGLLAVGLMWGMTKSSTHAVRRAGELASGQDNSAAARWEFYRASAELAVAHPLLGVGPEGFHRYYPAVQRDLRWFAKYNHSLTMSLLSETGIPAALLFYAGLVLVARPALRRMGQDGRSGGDLPFPDRVLRLGLLLGVAMFLVHAQFDVDFQFVALPLTGALILGLAAGTPTAGEPDLPEPQDEPRSEWSIRPGMVRQYVGAALLMGLFLLNSVGNMGDYMASQAKSAADSGREDLALEFYRLAARWDPWQGETQRQAALIILGHVYTGQAPPELVQEMLDKAARASELDPHRAVSLSTRGRTLEAVGRWEEADPWFRRALELDPVNYPSFYLDVAKNMARAGKMAEARQYLRDALEKFPAEATGVMFNFRIEAIQQQLSDVYLNLALMEAQGSPAREELLEKAEALDPKGRAARFALAAERFEKARRLEGEGRKAEADALFRKVTEVFRALYAEEPTYQPVREYLRFLESR